MSTATDKQVNFLKNLFADATTLAEALTPEQQASVATQVAPIEDVLVAVLQGREVEKNVASDAISVMLGVVKAIKVVTAPPVPGGLVRFNPTKVIANRFAKGCQVCGTKVAEGAGFAILTRGQSWVTVCGKCATTTPEQRAAEVQAANEEQRLIAQARQQAQEAEAQAGADAVVLGHDLFVRAGVAGQVKPSVHVAIVSATGNNDLDFYTVKMTSHSVQVLRVLGGHKDIPISVCEGVKVLERLACVVDVPAAMRTFGQELGFCGRCGRHLTDETSRAVGLGPDCAGMY